MVKPDDPQVILAACGDSAIGTSGNFQRTMDGGQSWRTLPLPVEPNSPLYGFAVNPANPDRLLSYSLFGELYASEDAGDSWQKVKREFGEDPGDRVATQLKTLGACHDMEVNDGTDYGDGVLSLARNDPT